MRKKFDRKFLSVLVTLVMMISLLPAVTLPARAAYPNPYSANLGEPLALPLTELTGVSAADLDDGDYSISVTVPVNNTPYQGHLYWEEARTTELNYPSEYIGYDPIATTYDYIYFFTDQVGDYTFDITGTGTSYSGTDYTIDRTITIEVADFNTAPSFVGGGTGSFSIAQNSSATDIRSLFHASDMDAGQTLTWSQHTAPVHGTLTISGATALSGSADITLGGTMTYTPAAGYAGTDSFTVSVSDGTAAATRTISVTVLSSDAGLTSVAGQADGTPGAETGADAAHAVTWGIDVANAKATLERADIAVAANATFSLYSNAAFSTEVTGAGTIALTSGGATTVYIKVTA